MLWKTGRDEEVAVRMIEVIKADSCSLGRESKGRIRRVSLYEERRSFYGMLIHPTHERLVLK